MPDCDHGGTPGWREQLAAAIAECERHEADGFDAPHRGRAPLIPLAALRAALAASSPQEGGGVGLAAVQRLCDEAVALYDCGLSGCSHRDKAAVPVADLRAALAASPAGVQVDREARDLVRVDPALMGRDAFLASGEAPGDGARVDREAAVEAVVSALKKQYGWLYVIGSDPDEPDKITGIDLYGTVEHVVLPALAPLLGTPEGSQQ